MTTETPPAWSLAMARSEMGFDIAAGSLAIDPIAAEGLPENDNAEESRLALSRFVTLMRRKEGISIEALADKADIEVGELLAIEKDAHHAPEVRTIYKLAMVFGVSQKKLMGLSGLTRPKDVSYVDQAVRYAARSESIELLSAEEQAALDGLISILSETKDAE